MDIMINAENVAMSGAMETYIHDKIARLTRFLPNIVSATVDVRQQKSNRGPDQIIVQVTVRHSRGAIFRSEERVNVTDNIFTDTQAAVNLAADKMYRRVSRFKGKRKDARDRTGRFGATVEEIEVGEELPDDGVSLQDIPDAEQQESRIYRRKVVGVSPMSEEEAIEQLELLGHAFLMFHHAERNRINVLYKRANGGYGVLDPILD